MVAFFDYCRYRARHHAAFALAFHVPNESKSSIPRRVALKKAGLRAGVPDICIPVACRGYNSLWIEMKVKPNKPSPEQLELIEHLNAAGNYARVCWSATEAINLINWYTSNADSEEEPPPASHKRRRHS